MVIDINLLRTDRGGDPNIVINSEKNRYRNLDRINEILEADKNWRKLRYTLDTLNKQKNNCSKSFGKKIKNKELNNGETVLIENIDLININNEFIEKLNIDQIKIIIKNIDSNIENTNIELKKVEEHRDHLLKEVGNIVHPSVPISDDETNNRVERTHGTCAIKPITHVDLLLMIDGADYKRGSLIAGNRGYYLKGPAVFLAQALINYSLNFLYKKEFTCLYTPFFMKKSVMSEVAQLSQFDEELYKVSEKAGELEPEEKYLIATSEQTIAAYHRDEWLNPSDLPLKYAGLSTCFRQEVGSHGRDTSGIFRVHQFEKVEQFVLCSPLENESWAFLDYMIENSERLCQNLGFSYRIVSIVSGALNNAAAKKFDLEAWFPGSQAFRELVSCSNCTDYQSRRLGIRFGCTKQANKEVKYVHMLNSTMCAVTRYLCCLLETHQTENGINIPDCLHPYLPDSMKFIPFKKTFEQVRKN